MSNELFNFEVNLSMRILSQRYPKVILWLLQLNITSKTLCTEYSNINKLLYGIRNFCKIMGPLESAKQIAAYQVINEYVKVNM